MPAEAANQQPPWEQTAAVAWHHPASYTVSAILFGNLHRKRSQGDGIGHEGSSNMTRCSVTPQVALIIGKARWGIINAV
jgi:crotonobetainyl-CoA:carnitine CoA-transferase CaiB-like acyl-CoA transferase